MGNYAAQYVDKCIIDYLKTSLEKKKDKFRNIAKRLVKKPDAYKCLKQDLEYSAKIYGCSMHELHDPKLEYPEDIEKAAGQFSMSGEDFIGRFLEYDPGEMSYKTIHCPCDFLKDDGACALGDCKPVNCRKYPYTDQPDRMGSWLSIIESAAVCPVVYEIMERLKEEYRFIKRKRVYPNDPCPCRSGLKSSRRILVFSNMSLSRRRQERPSFLLCWS